jgi:hypothetical protein
MKIFYYLLTVVVISLSNQLLAAETACAEKPCFSELDHEQLTKVWKDEHYDYTFAHGRCHICLAEESVVSQRGCIEFGEPHGFCHDCLLIAVEDSSWFNVFYGENSVSSIKHFLKDKTTHQCKITESGLEKFFANDSVIPPEWSSFPEKLKAPLLKNKERLIKRQEITSLPSLCKTCNKFKFIDEESAQFFQSGTIWFILCPGCGGHYSLMTNACSILHCSYCLSYGADISTCAYCFQIKVDNEVKREGFKPTSDHICPSDCYSYFHAKDMQYHLPSKMKLVCMCKKAAIK